jgi:transposase
MSNAVEVITSVQRRRRWSAGEKQQLVAASLEPGASVSAIAREAGIHPSQLYGWRRQLCAGQAPVVAFAPVRVAEGSVTNALPVAGTIEVEFAKGLRVRITGAVDPSLVTATIAILAKAESRR